MTTATDIHTFEDILRILDDHPEWLEELRARLLTRELLELPDAFAKFVVETNRRFEEINLRFDELTANTNRRFEETNARIDTLAADTNRRFNEHSRDIRKLQDDVGILKGAHARNVAARDYGWMTRNMGLLPVRILPMNQVDEFAIALREMGVARNEFESFRLADMLIEAADADGETRYIAVEVSFTVDGRDTGRALRNAEYLAKLTGKPVRAAVVGANVDDRVRALVESGEVYWHQFSDRDLQAD